MSRGGSELKASSERFDATRRETAEDVVMGLYHRYYARARRIAQLDPLGLRYRLPPRSDAWVRNRLRKPHASTRLDVSLEELHHSESCMEQGLVLLAEVR